MTRVLQRHFQTCCWWKSCSFYSLLYFLLLNFIDPALIYMHGRFGASLICMSKSEESVGDRQWHSSVTAHGTEGQNYLAQVLQIYVVISIHEHISQKGSCGEDWLTFAATTLGAAPGWHPELRQFGFNSGHWFIDSQEAQLGEVPRVFLLCRGGTNKLHETILIEVCLTLSGNRGNFLVCPGNLSSVQGHPCLRQQSKSNPSPDFQ